MVYRLHCDGPGCESIESGDLPPTWWELDHRQIPPYWTPGPWHFCDLVCLQNWVVTVPATERGLLRREVFPLMPEED